MKLYLPYKSGTPKALLISCCSPVGDPLSHGPRQLCGGSHSAAPLNSHRTADVPSHSALRGSSEHNLCGKKVGRPCLRLRLRFIEVALLLPWPRVRRSQPEPLSLGSLGWWQNSPAPWPGPLLFETEERLALWCKEREARTHSCGTSPLPGSRAGTAVPHGSASHSSASHSSSTCLRERQAGLMKGLEKMAPGPPNLETSALPAPTSNSLERNQRHGESSLPFCPFTRILSPDEIFPR